MLRQVSHKYGDKYAPRSKLHLTNPTFEDILIHEICLKKQINLLFLINKLF